MRENFVMNDGVGKTEIKTNDIDLNQIFGDQVEKNNFYN